MIRFLLIFSLTLLPLSGASAAAIDVYTGEAVVADQGDGERRQALPRTLNRSFNHLKTPMSVNPPRTICRSWSFSRTRPGPSVAIVSSCPSYDARFVLHFEIAVMARIRFLGSARALNGRAYPQSARIVRPG